VVAEVRERLAESKQEAHKFDVGTFNLRKLSEMEVRKHYQILINAGGRTIHSEIQKIINSIWNKEELPKEWKESNAVPIYKKGDKTDCSNYTGISLV
jgi:predicted CopG family antitoxin